MLYLLVAFMTFVVFTHGEDCNVREYKDGTVCVCDASFCDTVPALEVTSGNYQLFSSSKAKIGFYSTTGPLSTAGDSPTNTIKIDRSTSYQKIIGFGGAFTDAAGININSLPSEAQEKLLESYFGETGVGYSLCRVPIGGTDFSTRGYSYDDHEDDVTLEHFALQPDDLTYKIPFIQKAKELRNNNLNLFASAWSAPVWMKTNHDWSGVGSLKDEYYQLWADYTLKFYQEYEKHGITFWGMTTQNEPVDGFIPSSLSKINSMGWLPEQMNKWVGENLGPTLRNSSFKDLKIILHDDSRLTLPFLRALIDNELTMKYADGAAVHWYANNFTPAILLKLTQTDKEGWFFISSEACNGFEHGLGLGESVLKGSWERGENYVDDILENLEYGAGGWVDWNMVLNETGGPTYIDNIVDSPILVNSTLQEFYKQPMYYTLGHFSKFVIPGSVRLETTLAQSQSNLKVMAFLRPDNLTAIIIYNSGTSDIKIQIEDSKSQTAVLDIQARSINTALFE